jgi:hypothetical protein
MVKMDYVKKIEKGDVVTKFWYTLNISHHIIGPNWKRWTNIKNKKGENDKANRNAFEWNTKRWSQMLHGHPLILKAH